MPLHQTKYGGECPLGVFMIDDYGGGYTADPLEACFGNPELGLGSCNYFRAPEEGEEFNPSVQCQCPANMTKIESKKLKDEYFSLIEQGKAEGTKKGFWRYVWENY